MTIAQQPYFLNNPEWFTFDEKECRYFLTDKAPQKAIDSYNDFYGDLEHKKDFYKNSPDDVIWWLDTPDRVGEWLFSFDRVAVFNMFSDYPHELTPEQKEVFDRENPYWADFFSDR